MRSRLAVVLSAGIALGCSDEAAGPTAPGELKIQAAPTNSGNGQVDTVLATLQPLRVLVAQDNAPVPNTSVVWRTSSPDTAMQTSTVTTATDASGIAQLALTFDRTPREYTIEASVANAAGSPVTFTAISTPATPARLRLVSGDAQADSTNARLSRDYTVRVTDSYDNGIDGIVVDWAVTSGGGAVSPASTRSSSGGYASARHTLGPEEGEQVVSAIAPTVTHAGAVTFTAMAHGFGELQITTSTTGVDLDPDGYGVMANGPMMRGSATGVNETVTLRLRTGEYGVSLNGVAINCDIGAPPTHLVTIANRATANAAFDITCATAAVLMFVSDRDDCYDSDYYYYYDWPCDNPAYYDIYTIKANGSGLTRLTTAAGYDAAPAWSADGGRIAFTSPRDGNGGRVYVMNADGSEQARVSPLEVNDLTPTWSLDGLRIAFSRFRDGNFDIYVMNSDGSNVVRLTSDPAVDGNPAWSPDGTQIAFMSERDGDAEVFVMNADGSAVTQLTSNTVGDFHPAWSPDGARIVFARAAGGGCFTGACLPSGGPDADLFVMNADGSAVTLLLASPQGVGYTYPNWSPDGRWIAFESTGCGYSFDGHCWYSWHGIQAVSADGARVESITTAFGSDPAWKP